MAEFSSMPGRHFDLNHCLRFLESKNSTKQLSNHAVSRYQKFVTSGPDSFLLLFQKSLRSHDVRKILNYLRNFEILDVADCERISSESISDLMVTELVTMIYTKDPHAFWYFTHSLRTNGLFRFFHGDVHCCVCEEVQAKEKEIDDTLLPGLPHEDNETIFPFTVATKIEINQFFLKVKNSAMDGKLAKDLKKKLQQHTKELQNRLDEFRQVVGPPMRELKTALKTYVKNSNEKIKKQSQPLPEVLIAIQNDEPDAEFSTAEDDSKPVFQDEEAGHKMPSKPKPISIIFSVPILDAVEGRKKYIAFVIFSFFTLYSYVDSIIKIIPV